MGRPNNPLVEIVVSKIAVFVVAKSKIWPVMFLGLSISTLTA